MNSIGYFIVGLLCFTVVSSRRPFEPNYQRILDTREDEQNYRLPNNTKPETYDITIMTKVDEDSFDFTGKVDILLVALEASTNIVLHARQITILTVSLINTKTLKTVTINDPAYDDKLEFLTIMAKTLLEKDTRYLLSLTYKGELRTDNDGFYRSSYEDENGFIRWLATTQFESTNARHAFPCYDEPAFKAKFTIRIIHGTTYNAISNMPVKEIKIENGRTITEFEETPVMSSYLIAFIVSDFQYKEKETSDSNPTLQRVYTIKNQIDQIEYALEEGVNILNAIAKYLNVPFSLPKMYQAAISDFTNDGMENWGLATYKEQYLLYDPNVHLSTRKFDISTSISHECGHQWFGNLVTPKWWTYIWLNEGFGTLFEFLGTGLVHPEWNIFNYFVANKLQPVLRYDAQSTTRAMNTYAESPNEIASLLDDIAFDKSASVIRMFLHALGEETFKKALKYYLTANAFNVVEENQLFESLDKAAKEDKTLDSTLNVKDLFGSWSNQKGFPLLKVTRNYSDGSVTLEQQKYDSIDVDVDKSIWWIPFNVAAAKKPDFNNTTPYGWLSTRKQILQQSNNAKWENNDWLLFNCQQTGFYRVMYDEKNYKLINKELISGNIESIHQINRAQYIDDLSAFVSSGRLAPIYLFNALTYLKRETAYAPWESAKQAIIELYHILIASGKFVEFKKFVANLVQPLYLGKTLEGIEGEQFLEKYLRSIAVNMACQFGVEECLKDTYIKFKDYIIGGNKPSPNIRALIVINGIRNATDAEISRVWSLLQNQRLTGDERNEIITSFANIQSDTNIQLYLNKTIDSSAKLTQSIRLSVVQSILGGSQNGLSLTLTFLRTELEKVNSVIGSVKSILKLVAGKIRKSDQQTEFNTVLGIAKENGYCTATEIEALQKIVTDKIEWMNNNLKHFEDAIPKFKPSSASRMTIIPSLLILLFCTIRWNLY